MKNFALLFLLLIFMNSCAEHKEDQKSETETKKEEPKSEAEIKKEVLTAFNSMYDVYSEGTDEYFKFYEDDFTRVTPSGEVKIGIEEPRKEWNEYLKTYSLYVESYTEPRMVVSEEQVITIGEFVEYFINRETSDSIYNRGIYMAAWKQQEDGVWKISMDTWHAGLEEE